MNTQNQSQEQVINDFMTSLLGGLANNNPLIVNLAKNPNFWNNLPTSDNDIQNQINIIDSILKNIVPNGTSKEEPVTPDKQKDELVAPNAPVKETVKREEKLPVPRKINFDIDSGLSLTFLKDAIFSMVLLTMEKDNIDWSGKRGNGLLPNAPGFNIVDASKKYYTGSRVEKIEQYVHENILKNEETFGLFLNKLYGQLIEE
jgi:hypothetical protein